MTQRLNEKFTSAKYVVSQLKDREQRLKKDYNTVNLILSKSGFGWDINLKMATTIEEKWEELPDDLQKWKNKPFPYYEDLHEIYNGKVAEGKHCRRSSEKAYKSEHTNSEADGCMNTPSPTIPVMQSTWPDFSQEDTNLDTDCAFNYEVHMSQYRATGEEHAAREEQGYSQSQATISVDAYSPQACSDVMAGSQKRKNEVLPAHSSKKCKKNSDNSMQELLALRREELEAYKDLTERQLQLKQRQLEKSDPNNDPYSMSKCMEKLKTLSLSQQEHLKAINFLKADREAREILMGCEMDLADAFIKGSISN